MKIIAICGSSRTDSSNHKLIEPLAILEKDELKISLSLTIKLVKLLVFFVFFLSCNNAIKVKTEITPKVTPSMPKRNWEFAQNTPLNLILDSLHISKKSIRIEIDKSEHILSIFNENKLLKKYPIVLGNNLLNDKLCEGDRCTPEGTFHILNKYKHHKWSRFLWLNYPTNESRKKHAMAIKNNHIPENARIGGEVGIHGVPKNCDWYIDSNINWTLGCISMKNKDVNELYPFISEKTEIKIVK